jgi:hypothetical protein
MTWRFGWILMAAIGLMGCAPLPPETAVVPEYTQEQRGAAVEYALSQNLVLQSLITACQSINDPARLYAQEAQQHWWKKNWSIVAAANAEMEVQTRQQQLRLGDITGQLLLIRFIYLAEQRSVTHLTEDIKKSTSGENTCRIYLEPYVTGQKDLQHSEHGPVLTFIQSVYPQVATSTPQVVPLAANRFKAEYNAGRSLFEVEKTVREKLCIEPEILNIFNRWPREMYGVYCEKKDPSLIVCEWGECAVISGL